MRSDDLWQLPSDVREHVVTRRVGGVCHIEIEVSDVFAFNIQIFNTCDIWEEGVAFLSTGDYEHPAGSLQPGRASGFLASIWPREVGRIFTCRLKISNLSSTLLKLFFSVCAFSRP